MGNESTRAWEIRGVVYAVLAVVLILVASQMRRPLGDVLDDLAR